MAMVKAYHKYRGMSCASGLTPLRRTRGQNIWGQEYCHR